MIATHQEDLVLDTMMRTKEYFVDTVQHIHVNEHLTENRISTGVKKEYVKKDDFGHLIELQVTSREQSNKKGMLGIEDRLSVLFQKLILYLNDQGKIKSVVNLREIKQDWYDEKKSFRKDFKHEIEKIDDFLDALDLTLDDQQDFIQIIEKSDIATLLLPPIYSQELSIKESLKHSKLYNNFFGNKSIPITINTSIIAQNEITNGYQICRSGEIDYVHIDLNGIKNFFRKNYNNQSLPVALDVAYLETLDLDEYHTVDTATLMVGIEIKDLYQFRQISKTQKI